MLPPHRATGTPHTSPRSSRRRDRIRASSSPNVDCAVSRHNRQYALLDLPEGRGSNEVFGLLRGDAIYALLESCNAQPPRLDRCRTHRLLRHRSRSQRGESPLRRRGRRPASRLAPVGSGSSALDLPRLMAGTVSRTRVQHRSEHRQPWTAAHARGRRPRQVRERQAPWHRLTRPQPGTGRSS